MKKFSVHHLRHLVEVDGVVAPVVETGAERGFVKRMARLQGTIVSLSVPEAGFVEVEQWNAGLFFPGKSGHIRGRDENRAVTFYLGFLNPVRARPAVSTGRWRTPR